MTDEELTRYTKAVMDITLTDAMWIKIYNPADKRYGPAIPYDYFEVMNDAKRLMESQEQETT